MKLETKNKIIDEALKEHYRETMERKRVPSDYLVMFTEGGEANAVADAIEQATLRCVVDTLTNYGVSITNEGVLVPYSDEWDYLYDTPRRTLLRGNDQGESCNKLWQALLGQKR